MTASADDIRARLHELADQLPADATWDDVIEEARFRRAVEAGIAAADRGSFATDAEVREAFANQTGGEWQLLKTKCRVG